MTDEEQAWVEEAERNLVKAKMFLMNQQDQAFISSVFLQVPHKIVLSIPKVDTAYTDGKQIVFSAQYLKDLDLEAFLFVMLHETWHIALGHCTDPIFQQIAQDYPDELNRAMDHVINLMIKSQGIFVDATKYCCDPQFENMDVMKVFHKILDPSAKEEKPENPEMPSDVQHSPFPDDQAKEDFNNMIMGALTVAEQLGSDAGDLPAEIQRRINDLRKPKLKWQRQIAALFSGRNNRKINPGKARRKYLPALHLPSYKRIKAGNLTIALDVSGSLSEEQLTELYSEVHSLYTQLNLKSLRLLQFNTQIVSDVMTSSLKEFNAIEIRGHGGTNIDPVFNYLKDEKTDALLIYTDGEFTPYTEAVKHKVIWVIKDNPTFTSDIGTICHVE